MDNVATLPNGDTIEIILTSKENQVLYIFKNAQGNKIGEYHNGIPATLSNQCNIANQIKNSIDPNREFRPVNLNKKVSEIKELLQLIYENQVFQREQKRNSEIEEQKKQHQDMIQIAQEKLQSEQHILTYIGSLIDWVTAGERLNIMYAFTVFAGQVIINNPVSLIPLGEAGSGKTHIQETALSLIPKEYVVNEKKITEAALFNRAKKDKYFYDGKIVNYGDMGGSNDHDFMQESKNLMKELQSEGYLNKPLNVQNEDGDWVVQDLELIGRPCLTYTTVPNHIFDEQEMSRSIFITPRMDNQFIFNRRNSAIEFKHGRTFRQMVEYEKELELVPYMVLHLKEVMRDIDIINPHVNIVINFLKQSNFYKRDFPKFNGLLKTITALNFYQHDVLEIDGHKVILTSISDVQLFMSLIKPYHESISANIAPKAVDVLNDYRNHRDEWINKGNRESIGAGITTNEYYELQSLGLSKQSVKKYFYELHDKGFLKVVDRVGKSNIYDLSDSDTVSINEDLQNISHLTYKNIEYELGPEIADIVKADKYIDNLSIMNFDKEVEKPVWL
jgi:hypothetical protein